MTWTSEDLSLNEYIERLLRDGKSHTHPDFQKLMACFGQAKVLARERELLVKLNEEEINNAKRTGDE